MFEAQCTLKKNNGFLVFELLFTVTLLETHILLNDNEHTFFCFNITKEDFFMPKTKFQEVIFTIMMVFVMVYAMICYNIALNVGGLNTSVFLSAFHEFVIMAPVAFVLDFFFVGHIAKRTAFRIVNPEKENPFHLVIAISVVSVAWMCPL